MDNLLAIAARVLMAQIFIISGYGKLMAYAATEANFSKLGIPMLGIVLPLVILVELGGGLALLVGFKTRWIAAILAAFTIVSALIAHRNFADQMQLINFMKNLAMTGGLLLFCKYGAGGLSIDERNRRAPY